MYLANHLHSGYFDIPNIVEIVVDRLFVIDLRQFLQHIYILIVVRFHLLQERFQYFVVFQLLFFLLAIQMAYSYYEYRAVQGFFLLSILCVSWEISLKLIKICKLYGLDLIFV